MCWTQVHNLHNFAWRETHNSKGLVGSPQERDSSVSWPVWLRWGNEGGNAGHPGGHRDIVALFEHSRLGRVMGRMEAKGKHGRTPGEWKRESKVTQEMMDTWVNEARVELRGGGVDLTNCLTVTSGCRTYLSSTRIRCACCIRSSHWVLVWPARMSTTRLRSKAPSSNRRRHRFPKPGIPVRVGVGLPWARRPKDRASLF